MRNHADCFPYQSSLITRLHTDLRDVRQAYLSTATPRKTQLHIKTAAAQPLFLTDRQREEIDASTKLKLRELNGSIRTLADAEQLRQNTETALLQKKFSRGLGALGSWAAGGGSALGIGSTKSPEHIAAEDGAKQIGAHRESILLYLRQSLQEVIKIQQNMMEARISREMEKKRSVLAKAGGGYMGMGVNPNDFGMSASTGSLGGSSSGRGFAVEEEERKPAHGEGQHDITDEQRQMFEEGNQIMLKQMQNALDKVRFVVRLVFPPYQNTTLIPYTGRPRNLLWKFPSCRPCLWATWKHSRPILTSWWRTLLGRRTT